MGLSGGWAGGMRGSAGEAMHKGKNFRIKDANILGCFFGGKGEKGMRAEGRGRAEGGLRRGGRKAGGGFAAGSKLCFEYLKWLRNERADEGRREAEEGKEGRRERRGGREAGMRRKKKTEYAGRTPSFFCASGWA